MEAFRHTGGVSDGDDDDLHHSSIRPSVSLLDQDDDDDDDTKDYDDGGGGGENENEIHGVTNSSSDTGMTRRLTTIPIRPPSEPPPPPPPSDDDETGDSYSMLPITSHSFDMHRHFPNNEGINDDDENDVHVSGGDDDDRLQQLRHCLRQIRHERQTCRIRQRQCDCFLEKLSTTYQIRQREQHGLLADYYMGYTTTTTTTDANIHAPCCTTWNAAILLSQYWNVTASDAFCIVLEHGNTIASINGLRLGAVVTITAPSASASHHSAGPNHTHTSAATTINKPNTPMRPHHRPGTEASSGSTTTTTTTVTPPPTTMKYKIPWAEINAALGQVAVLITTMEQNLQDSPITTKPTDVVPPKTTTMLSRRFQHEFVCLGSTSKIAVRKPTPALHHPTITGATTTTSNTFYNLFYTEENTIFHMLLNTKKRNFDIALQLLLSCVHDVCQIVQERDRTVYIPYDMNIKQGTIATLPITYFSGHSTKNNNNKTTDNAASMYEHAEQWTRAMKYLLSNLKHALSYRGIGLWNVEAATDTAIATDVTVIGTGTE